MATATEIVLSGHAARFYDPADSGTEFDMGDRVLERIAAGAFSRSLVENPDIFALLSHDPARPIARTTSLPASLFAREDARGLAVRILPLDTNDGRDALRLVESRTVRSMSFAFTVEHDSWEKSPHGTIRTLHDVNLHEVSLVARAAYPATDIHVETVARGLTFQLGQLSNRAGEIGGYHPHPKPRKTRMIIERSDERRGQHAPELQKQTRLRLYQRRADLLAELVRLDKLSADDRQWQEDRITRELAEVDREEKQLDAAMESRSGR